MCFRKRINYCLPRLPSFPVKLTASLKAVGTNDGHLRGPVFLAAKKREDLSCRVLSHSVCSSVFQQSFVLLSTAVLRCDEPQRHKRSSVYGFFSVCVHYSDNAGKKIVASRCKHQNVTVLLLLRLQRVIKPERIMPDKTWCLFSEACSDRERKVFDSLCLLCLFNSFPRQELFYFRRLVLLSHAGMFEMSR